MNESERKTYWWYNDSFYGEKIDLIGLPACPLKKAAGAESILMLMIHNGLY